MKELSGEFSSYKFGIQICIYLKSGDEYLNILTF